MCFTSDEFQHQDEMDLVAFYVEEHDTRTLHSAFRGPTPDEAYFGAGTQESRAAALDSVLPELLSS